MELQGVDVDGFEIFEVFLEWRIPFRQAKTLTIGIDYSDINDIHSIVL